MNVCERSYKSTFTSPIESNSDVGGVQVWVVYESNWFKFHRTWT